MDAHNFHALNMAGRIPFSYIEDIHMRFMKNYGKVAGTALAYAMNDEFSRVLHQQMEYYSSNPNADTINRVKGEIAEVSLTTKPLPYTPLVGVLCYCTVSFVHNRVSFTF